MPEITNPVTGPQKPAEQPIVGVSSVDPAVSGSGYGTYGVSGISRPPVQTLQAAILPPASDGVYGDGLNGVHGVSSSPSGSGVLGEGTLRGPGVSGTSPGGHGVHGVNGGPSGVTPQFSAGVFGESVDGYGVFGASKNASGVYGTSGAGHFAGEFDGDVSISGKLTTKNDVSVSGKLAATGDVSVSGKLAVTDDVSVSGKVTAKDVILSGADCAEEFDEADCGGVEAGMVVVFDECGRLRPATTAYDKRVAGVVSGAGAFRPGVILDRRDSAQPRVPVALVGKVYCRVDASYGPVELGDLLTTSATPGCAMKAGDPFMAFGSVIGKALAPLARGCDLIPIVVALG